MKVGAAIVTAQGAKGLNAIALFPIEPQTPEQSVEEAYKTLLAYSDIRANGNDNRNTSGEAGLG